MAGSESWGKAMRGEQGSKPDKAVIRGMEGTLRISSGNVGMESTRQYTSTIQHSVTISVTNAQFMATGTQIRSGETSKDKVPGEVLSEGTSEKTQSNMQNSLLSMSQGYYSIKQIKSTTGKSPEELIDEIRVRTITFLINLLGGARKRGASSDNDSLIDKLFKGQESSKDETMVYTDPSEIPQDDTLYSVSMNTVNFQLHYSYAESESTSFHTQGTVVTEDGREISFGVDMEMSRAFTEEYDLNYIRQNATFCDPLVINLGGNVAEVSDQKFSFDIDHDGILDTISQLSGKSGYLALDLNEDGVINDGSELFGTSSGNGFKDLAKYDSDGNGWIDENDDIWSKLLIWSKDGNGNDALYHLSEKGVGAISLQNKATDFSLNSRENNGVNARIRSTGIFLYENGQVGTVQHVDLAK